jgi:hypothetical protein
MTRSTPWLAVRLGAPLVLACACATGDPVGDPHPEGIAPASDDDDGRAFVDAPDEVLDVGLPPIADLGSGGDSTGSDRASSDGESSDEDVESSESDDGDPPDGVPDGECCEPHAEPLCEDLQVLTCVCVQRPSCCQVSWDASCVDAVEELGCGVC